ncbi:hypothetical protein VNO77_19601 [Canavalia gladiata]|uniref:F-box domain-containing protein n=1 Tax=Canavalia gladiata TaxID=3824 RepID=A0AAN9LMX7_CANGL
MWRPQEQQDSAMFPVLFDELVVEILSCSSVKSLMRFKCACMYWNTLISSPSFIKLHLQRSTENYNFDNLQIMLKSSFTYFRELYQVSHSVRSLLDSPMPNAVHDLRYRISDGFGVVGSCNGLICLVSVNLIRHFHNMFPRQPTGYLWNLTTRLRSQPLPCFHVDWRRLVYTRFGFGHDRINNAYKVVAVHYVYDSSQSQKSEVEIYSTGEGSWRQLPSFPNVVINNDGGLYLNGFTYWATVRDPTNNSQVIIVSFDLERETCTQILLPPAVAHDHVEPTLVAFKDHLCVWQNNNGTHLVIWQMKEHRFQQSWIQLMNVSYFDIRMNGLESVTFIPLCIFRNGDILMLSRDVDVQWRLILWNRRNGIIQHSRIRTNGYVSDLNPKVFVKSLVSPR